MYYVRNKTYMDFVTVYIVLATILGLRVNCNVLKDIARIMLAISFFVCYS